MSRPLGITTTPKRDYGRRFEHVSAGERTHPLFSFLAWAVGGTWKATRVWPLPSRAAKPERQLRDEVVSRALPIRVGTKCNPFNDTLAVRAEQHSSPMLQGQGAPPTNSCRCRSGGPRPGRPVAHRPGHRQIRVGRLAGWQAGRVQLGPLQSGRDWLLHKVNSIDWNGWRRPHVSS